MLRVGLQHPGVEHALDQPADGTFGEGLEHPGGERATLGEPVGERRGEDACGEPRHDARRLERDSTLPLDLGRSLLASPRDGGEVTEARLRQRVAEDITNVFDEERARLGVAVLVGDAPAEVEQPLGAGDRGVEEVALAIELVLAKGERKPAGRSDLAAIVVGKEWVRARGSRPFAFLEATREDSVEAAGTNGLG